MATTPPISQIINLPVFIELAGLEPSCDLSTSSYQLYYIDSQKDVDSPQITY